MATSGSIDWTVSRADIISAAYRLVLTDEDFTTPSTNQTNNATLLLNGIVKSYNAMLGMPLWAIDFIYLLPFSGTYAGNFSTGHITSSYTYTTTSATSSSGGSTITLTSVTGVTSGYNIGVELEDGNMHWTTVNGAPSGSVVTLTAALTADVESGASVYIYQTRANRPLRFVQAYVSEPNLLTSSSDVPIEVISTDEFIDFSNKATESSYPLYINYEPTLIGRYKIWPRFSDGDRVVVIRVHRALEDFDATGDTPDFPQEYNLPLIYELAITLAPTYNVDIDKLSKLEKARDRWLSGVMDNDREEGSLYFQPNTSMSGV